MQESKAGIVACTLKVHCSAIYEYIKKVYTWKFEEGCSLGGFYTWFTIKFKVVPRVMLGDMLCALYDIVTFCVVVFIVQLTEYIIEGLSIICARQPLDEVITTSGGKTTTIPEL